MLLEMIVGGESHVFGQRVSDLGDGKRKEKGAVGEPEYLIRIDVIDNVRLTSVFNTHPCYRVCAKPYLSK